MIPFWAAVVVAVALYLPSLGHAFLWDDLVQISGNPAVTDGVPIARYFTDRATTSSRPEYNTRIYRPLRNLALRALWRLSDAAPAHRSWFFHGANLLLYLLAGWLVLALVYSLCADVRAASLAAGLWLLLPVHAEDVLYASAFGDLLSMVLQLGGLCLVTRATAADAEHPRRDTIAALLVFVLAVLVKEMAVTSALVVPAYLWCERRELLRTRRGQVALLVIGHGLVALAYLALRTVILGRVGQGDASAGALGRALVHLPWLVLLNLRVALQPLGHSPDYGPELRGVLGSALGVLGLLALVVLAWRWPRRGLRFGALLFLLALLPVLQLLPMWTLLADRFLLVPTIGLAVIAGALVAAANVRDRSAVFGATAVCALAGLIWSAGLLIERSRFADDYHLWAWAVETVPDSSLAHHNFGLVLLDRGDPAGALPHLERSYALGRRHARLYLHLASAYEGVGQLDQAERAAKMAVERDPDSGASWAQLASLQRRRGDLDGAEASVLRARQVGAAEVTVLRQRAPLRIQQRRYPEALADYRRLTELEPADIRAWRTRGELAISAGLLDEARLAASRCTGAPGCDALRASARDR